MIAPGPPRDVSPEFLCAALKPFGLKVICSEARGRSLSESELRCTKHRHSLSVITRDFIVCHKSIVHRSHSHIVGRCVVSASHFLPSLVRHAGLCSWVREIDSVDPKVHFASKRFNASWSKWRIRSFGSSSLWHALLYAHVWHPTVNLMTPRLSTATGPGRVLF